MTKLNNVSKAADLCDSCSNVIKVQGYGRELKFCTRLASMSGDSVLVNFAVEKCGTFEAKGTVSRYEMEQMAVYIEKKKDAPGFMFTKHIDGTAIEFNR